MLKSNFDPLARPFDDVLERWTSSYRGRPIRVNFRKLVGANSGVDRLTHLMHPYPAKLLLNIPLFFLNCGQLATRGSSLYDPFCGSGTVLLEGLIAGHHIIGCDANPLARLIATAKTTVLPPSLLEDSFKTVLDDMPRYGEGVPTGSLHLERWFSAPVLRKLDRLATALRRLPVSPERRFLEVCFSATILRVSLTDPTLSVPVRLKPSKPSLTKDQRTERRRWLKQRTQADAIAEFISVVHLNIARMTRLHEHVSASSKPVVLGYDARTMTTTPVDLIITSPPYGSAQKYIRANSLALQWLDLAPDGLRCLERQTIGREHFNSDELPKEMPLTISSSARSLELIARENPLRAHIAATFLAEMRDALNRVIECLRPGGHLVLIVGNNFVCGSVFHTQRYLTQICESLGLEVRLALIDRIRSRGLITKRNGAAGVISEEWIVMFQKPLSRDNV